MAWQPTSALPDQGYFEAALQGMRDKDAGECPSASVADDSSD